MSLESLEKLQKKLFLEVRDIPFEFVPGTSLNYRKSIESMKKYKKGSCTPKHFYLGNLYEKQLRLNVLYVTYIFYWTDQEFLSKHLRYISRHLPEQYHLALEVGGRIIDATFDKPLAPTFPVNEFEKCKVSVEYMDSIVHCSPQERIDYVKNNMKGSHELQKFYIKLNKYIQTIRKNKEKSK